MKKLGTQKGITLVALIITIIVLLILAVVAIRAVQGDGIISHAKNARDDYQEAQANEDAILSGYLTDIEETIIGAPLELATYILGANKTGRDISEIVDFATFVFKDDETTEVDESTAVTTLNMGFDSTSTKLFAYIKYNNIAYKVVINQTPGEGDTIIYTSESLSEIYVPQGREGTTVQYDSNGDGTKEEWIIITDRNYKVEIVSANVMYDAERNGLTMGDEDASITTVTSDLDGDGTVGNDGDKAIVSYNNAITRINNYCKSLVIAADNEGVRSVGGTNNSAAPYNSTSFNAWFKGSATVASGDTQYEEDFVKLSYWNKQASNGEYWLASRNVMEDSEAVWFNLFFVDEGTLKSNNLWEVYLDGRVGPNGPSRGVRPVVINPSNI